MLEAEGISKSYGGVVALSGAGLKVLARTLNSNTSATWTGSGNITMDTSALNIAAGTTFDVQNDQSVTINGGTPAINNAGTFQKSAGTGTTTVYGGVAFNNTGSVLVQTGTLQLGQGTSTGSFDSTGGTLDFAFVGGGGTQTLSAAAAIAGGNVTFSAGTVNLNNATALGKGSQDFAVNGAGIGQNNFSMDGVTIQNFGGQGSTHEGGSYTSFGIPNPDALAEFKIIFLVVLFLGRGHTSAKQRLTLRSTGLAGTDLLHCESRWRAG